MSNRNNGNRIRGPQSALTSFLASKNISAAQIRDDVARRRAQAEAQAANERQEQEAELNGQDQGPSTRSSSAAAVAAAAAAAATITSVAGAARLADIESIAGPSESTAGPSRSLTRSRRNGKSRTESYGDDEDDNMDVTVKDGEGDGGQKLQNYQMQLMLLEQQNRKRLMMARNETVEAKVDKGKAKAMVNGKHEGKGKGKGKGKVNGKGRKKKRGSDYDDDDDDDDDYFDIAFDYDMYRKAPPAPGQFENCEQCSKRFTVTPYSKTGPEGGLLCASCGKLFKDSEKKANKTAGGRKAGGAGSGRKRRKIESDRMDGKIHLGARSLQQLCIEKVVAHHGDIEEFGDMPGTILERLSMIFTKKRVLGPKTLPLFLRPDLDTVAIHDAAYLEEEDYIQLFAVVPNVEKVVLHNACQFKDNVMEYMIEKAVKLKHLHLYAANLVSNSMWSRFISEQASQLETLKLEWLDASFEDWHIAELAQHCAGSLRRLKLKLCRRLGAEAIRSISQMHGLQHLSLSFSPAAEIPTETLVDMILKLGPGLQTLSLERFPDVNDEVLNAIRTSCPRLTKLRLSHNDVCTDGGFAALFSGWEAGGESRVTVDTDMNMDIDTETETDKSKSTNKNRNSLSKANIDTNTCNHTATSRLRFADFSSSRDANSEEDDNNNNNNDDNEPFTDNPDKISSSTMIGLGSAGFTALMKHARHSLTHLNISSCRHISRAALMDVFCFGSGSGSGSGSGGGSINTTTNRDDLYANAPARTGINNATSTTSNPARKTDNKDYTIGSAATALHPLPHFPSLKHIDLSFLPSVDEVVLQGIFRSCPALERLVAFGCFGIGIGISSSSLLAPLATTTTTRDIRDGGGMDIDGTGATATATATAVDGGGGGGEGEGGWRGLVVPRGVVLIGVPRAQDAIEQFGLAC